MYILNITYSVDDSVHTQWMEWMKKVHIPNFAENNLIQEYRFTKVLSTAPDESGHTYSIQLKYTCTADLDQFQKTQLPQIKNEYYRLYGDRLLLFATILKIIDE